MRLLRPELAADPPPADRARSSATSSGALFARPERLDPAAADVAVDEFCAPIARAPPGSRSSPRLATSTSTSRTASEGFYSRLAALEPPALFVWGDHDRLIPPGFSRHVSAALPDAQQVVLDDCGHVPQVELPDRTNRLIAERIASAGAVAQPLPRRRIARGRRRAG